MKFGILRIASGCDFSHYLFNIHIFIFLINLVTRFLELWLKSLPNILLKFNDLAIMIIFEVFFQSQICFLISSKAIRVEIIKSPSIYFRVVAVVVLKLFWKSREGKLWYSETFLDLSLCKGHTTSCLLHYSFFIEGDRVDISSILIGKDSHLTIRLIYALRFVKE